MLRRNHTILALDPGLRDLGYAILARKRLLASGVLSLRTTPKHKRVGRVRDALLLWLRAYRPRTLVLEQIPRRPLDLLAGLPALARLLHRVASHRRLRVAEYSAKAVRRSVVGNGWAGKREVAETLTTRFPELRVHLTHDRKWK